MPHPFYAQYSAPSPSASSRDDELDANALSAGQLASTIFDFANPQVLQTAPEIVLGDLANRVLDAGMSEPQFLNFMRVILGESGRFPQLAHAFVRNIEQTNFRMLCQCFTTCSQLNLSDPEAMARIFIGTLVHFTIVQEMLHGKDIVPMEQERLIENLVNLIVADQAEKT